MEAVTSKDSWQYGFGRPLTCVRMADVVASTLAGRRQVTSRRAVALAPASLGSPTTPLGAGVRQDEEDMALLTSSSIQALATAFEEEAPTSESAVTTLGLLAKLLTSGADISLDAATSSVSLLSSATEIVSTQPPDGITPSIKDVLVSFERVWLFLAPMDAEQEAQIVPLLHSALQSSVRHTLRSELTGELVQLDSCPPESTDCIVTLSSETLEVGAVAGVELPSNASASAGMLRVTLSQETVSHVEGLQALYDAAGLLDVHVLKLRVSWALAVPQIFLSHLFISAFSNIAADVGMTSAALAEDAQLVYRLPIEPDTQLLAAASDDITVSLASAALIANVDLQQQLKQFDANSDMALDAREMLAAQGLLLTRYWFWQCAEYMADEHRWDTASCQATAVERGWVTCACAHSGTFAVILGKGACGDGRVTDGEQCDDGNTEGGDGCSESCVVAVEDGWFCAQADTARASVCSDSSSCPPWLFGFSCEYLCSQELVENKCTGSRFSPTSFRFQDVDGAVGGLVKVDSGESINIPPGAFSGVETIGLRVYAGADFAPSANATAKLQRRDEKLQVPLLSGPVVSIGPDRLTFVRKAILTISYDPLENRVEEGLRVHSLDDAGKWLPLEEEHRIDYNTRVIKVWVWRTGTYAVMRKQQQPGLLEQLSSLSPSLIAAAVLAPVIFLAAAAYIVYRLRVAVRWNKAESMSKGSGTSDELPDTSSQSQSSKQDDDAYAKPGDTDVDIVVLRDMVHIDPLPSPRDLALKAFLPPAEVDSTVTGMLGFAGERSSRTSRASSPAPSSVTGSSSGEASVPIESLMSFARNPNEATRQAPPQRESAAGASFGAAASARDDVPQALAVVGEQARDESAAGVGRFQGAQVASPQGAHVAAPAINRFAASVLGDRNDFLASLFLPPRAD